jgi:molecular chaperone GrpE
MSEVAPSDFSTGPAIGDQANLTVPDIDALLAEFRAWILQANGLNDEAIGEAVQGPDLHTLLSQLIALRQEVNLQTRASRAQLEQNSETLRHLERALQTLENQATAKPESSAEQVRPLLKALVDIHDALGLARREMQRAQDHLLPVLQEFADARPTVSPTPRLPWLARLFGLGAIVRKVQRPLIQAMDERNTRVGSAMGRVRRLADSMITGYTMSLQRVERILDQQGLTALACVGDRFDPETMEAVEVVPEPSRCDTEVIEEVRRGYLWNGRLFRAAQVRVACPERMQ